MKRILRARRRSWDKGRDIEVNVTESPYAAKALVDLVKLDPEGWELSLIWRAESLWDRLRLFAIYYAARAISRLGYGPKRVTRVN